MHNYFIFIFIIFSSKYMTMKILNYFGETWKLRDSNASLRLQVIKDVARNKERVRDAAHWLTTSWVLSTPLFNLQ